MIFPYILQLAIWSKSLPDMFYKLKVLSLRGEKKETVLETPGRMKVSRQTAMIHNRFSEPKAAAKLQSFCKNNNNKIRLSQSLAEIQIH